MENVCMVFNQNEVIAVSLLILLAIATYVINGEE